MKTMSVLNDKIEFRCSTETRVDFETLIVTIAPQLRLKLGRKVLAEDVFKLLLNAYKTAPWLIQGTISSKASFK
jgi:hypothetical protein